MKCDIQYLIPAPTFKYFRKRLVDVEENSCRQTISFRYHSGQPTAVCYYRLDCILANKTTRWHIGAFPNSPVITVLTVRAI